MKRSALLQYIRKAKLWIESDDDVVMFWQSIILAITGGLLFWLAHIFLPDNAAKPIIMLFFLSMCILGLFWFVMTISENGIHPNDE